MFRKYYKSVNDEVKTNRELIDKIFNQYAKTETNKNRSKLYSFGMRYGTTFAAVLVLCVAAAVYPKLIKLNETPKQVPQQTQPSLASEDILPAGDGYEYAVDYAAVDVNTGEITEYRPNAPEGEKVITKENKLNSAESTGEYTNRARVAQPDEEVNTTSSIVDYQADISQLKSVTEDEVTLATNTLVEKLGTKDAATGNLYIFEIAGSLETDEKSYYLGRWKWFVDDHSSLICEFVLGDDLNDLYECKIEDNIVKWSTTDNMFD